MLTFVDSSDIQMQCGGRSWVRLDYKLVDVLTGKSCFRVALQSLKIGKLRKKIKT